MSNINISSPNLKESAIRVINYAASKRLILLIIVVGGAIGLALVQTRSFLDVPRNEERYIEETLSIKYKQINTTILDEFKAATLDGDVNVDSSFNPNRSDPFNE